MLGLSRNVIDGMTLSGYRAYATFSLREARGSAGDRLLGLWPDAGAQCPACHADRPGVHALRTISGIGFGCVTHRLLHVDRCPRCGGAVRLASSRHGRVSEHHVPRPGHCEHSLGPRTCGHPLAELQRTDLTDWPAALEAQRAMDELCAVPSRTVGPPSASLSVLAALARWLMHPSVSAQFRCVPAHVRELCVSNWRWQGNRDRMLHIGRRSRTCVALVMSTVAPGYLTGDAERLAADLRAAIPEPHAGQRWYEGLPRGDRVVETAVRLAFPGAEIS